MKGKTMIMTVLAVVGVLVVIEVLGLLKLLYSVPSYKSFWDKRNNQTKTEDGLLYVALGDSTAQGIGASSPKKGYVGLIERYLVEKSGEQVQVVNLSASGARINDAITKQLPRLNELPVNDETVITMEIGANDMIDFDATEFGGDMDALLTQLPRQTIVANMPYFGGGRYRRLEPNVQVANDIMRELTAKHGLRMAPLYEVTKKNDRPWVNSADIFHPNNYGYRNWFRAFQSALPG